MPMHFSVWMWVAALLGSSNYTFKWGGVGGDVDWKMQYHPSVFYLANHDISRNITSVTGCQVQSFYERGTNTQGEYDQSQHNSPLTIYHSEYNYILSSE